MTCKFIQLCFACLLSLSITLSALGQSRQAGFSLAEFEKRAGKFNSLISLPHFERSTNEIFASVKRTIQEGNASLDRIGALSSKKVNFQNTIVALDDIGYQISLTDDRLSLLKETSTDGALRDAATDELKELEEWMVGLDYREDVYRAVKAFADTRPRLKGEDAKLLEETMRDYRRAGLELPKVQRDEVEKMRKELSRLTTDFESNVTKAQKAVKFTRDELEGVPADFLEQTKTGADEYTIMANITTHYLRVMDNAKREETREYGLLEQTHPSCQVDIAIGRPP